MSYIKNPKGIEDKSFEMIEEIVNDEYGGFGDLVGLDKKILIRVIHTSADFDYIQNLKLNNNVSEVLKNAIKEGATIYSDTNMVLSGINKTRLSDHGCDIKCYVADDEVRIIAKEKEITRSMAAVEKAMSEPGDKIFVFGNAPTALYKAMELADDSVKAIVGVPVGFVGAAESKDELNNFDIPNVTALGRKGGSNVAASVINAVLYDISDWS